LEHWSISGAGMSQAVGIKISFPRFVSPMFVLLDSQLNRFNSGTTTVSNGGVFLKNGFPITER